MELEITDEKQLDEMMDEKAYEKYLLSTDQRSTPIHGNISQSELSTARDENLPTSFFISNILYYFG